MLPVCLALVLAAPPSERAISGRVLGPSGAALEAATVFVRGSQRSTTSDAEGRFVLDPDQPGAVVLVAFREGFRPAEVQTHAGQSGVELSLQLLQMTESVTVWAGAPSEQRRLRPLDIVRVPGGRADVMRAIQGLAGVVNVDEGAGLFVRGGDQSEVLTVLDGVRLFHPYRFETATGGLYGTFEPFLLESVSFSSGGFSARHGNALSAVLDLDGLGRPARRELAATVGLAAVSSQLALPLGRRAGVRFSGNRTFTKLLFAVNGSPQRFSREPEGWDLNGSAHFESKPLGTFKAFAMKQRDEVGVLVEREAFADFLAAGSTNRLFSLSWDKFLSGSWRAQAALGDSKYVRDNQVGVVDIDIGDRRRSASFELLGLVGPLTLRTGADGEKATVIYSGRVPTRGGDLGGVDGIEAFEVLLDDQRLGAHFEVERRLGRFTPTLGMRTDRFSRARSTTVDPRLSAVMDLSRRHRLRIAWGIYHQTPGAEYYDTERGARDLEVMAARHHILGWEMGGPAERLHARVEAYYKSYERLPVTNEATGYDSSGYGSSWGADFYVRHRLRRFSLQANYSWLRARRRWTPSDQARRFDVPPTAWSPDFDVPHTLQAFVRFDATPRLTFGLGARVASGRPFTPVVGALPRPTGFSPVYGAINSDRLPRYERLDCSVSYALPPSKVRALFFVAGNNLLGRRNAFEYKYSADYTSREPVTSAAPRTFYFGVSMGI